MVGQRVLVVDGLELELAPDGPTGFAGVILIKNKYYQARLWDKRLSDGGGKRSRALPLPLPKLEA